MLKYSAVALLTLSGWLTAAAQQPAGIGTTTPNPYAALDISSATKGVLIPRLSAAQQTVLAGMLTTTQQGMLITDATSGHMLCWSGAAWNDLVNASPVTAVQPLTIKAGTNQLALNAGTASGDLLTWDGNNWVNTLPAVQHFSFTLDNQQPYLTLNYVIAYEDPNAGSAFSVEHPYTGEIYLMANTYAPVGFLYCDGSLLPISSFAALFFSLGTTYGGDGTTNFGLPNLQGRAAVNQGQGPGLSNYTIGNAGGNTTKTFLH